MIEIGRRVSVLYEGRFEDGTVFDNSRAHEGKPLVFVLGAGTVIPGLEKAVSQMGAHEKRTVAVPAAEAYGEYNPALTETVPASSFPNADKLPIGEYIMLNLGSERRRVKVASVEDGLITFDFNHEYAGRNLVFDLEITEVYGETGSLIENEQHSAGCTCGCHKVKRQLTGRD